MKKLIDLEELKQMLENGCTTPECAEYFKCSKGSLNVAMSRAKISMWKYKAIRAKKIAEYSQEHGCYAAANHFGITLDNVYAYRTRYFNKKTFKRINL